MKLTNPQTWNRYAYVLNNPLRLIDPAGLDYCDSESDDEDVNCGSDDGGSDGDPGSGDNSGGCDPTVDANCGNPPPVDQCDQSNPNCPLDIPVQIDPYSCPTGSNLDPNNQPMVGPGTTFATPQVAGAAAIAGVNQASQSVGLEYEGFVYQTPDGSYSFTSPLQFGPTSGGGGSVGISVPGGSQIVGVYHTHPDIPGTIPESFSVQDANAAGEAANGQMGAGGPGYNFVGTPEGNTYMFEGTSPTSGQVTLLSGPACADYLPE